MKQSLATSLVGICLLFLLAGIGDADARQWRATATTLARDYVQILDQRSANELVLEFWLAPELLEATPENNNARELLAQNLVLAIMHADISNTGVFTFRTLAPPPIATQNANRLPIAEQNLDPASVGIITSMKVAFTRALGKLGQGTHWFVYDGKGIMSCERGVFWVVYAGERYEYRTPIPGCPE